MTERPPECSGNVVAKPICLPSEMIAELDAVAKRENLFRGRSVIVRRACAEFLARYQRELNSQEAS
jgi:metal-responsive CopG/Arc/MetJ family transcriptional regulator